MVQGYDRESRTGMDCSAGLTSLEQRLLDLREVEQRQYIQLLSAVFGRTVRIAGRLVQLLVLLSSGKLACHAELACCRPCRVMPCGRSHMAAQSASPSAGPTPIVCVTAVARCCTAGDHRASQLTPCKLDCCSIATRSSAMDGMPLAFSPELTHGCCRGWRPWRVPSCM